ncbi:MAG: type II toxin-antitoxin system RelE/ParE family toxin [Proteobacteria bacterium]|nr:type II toxin-antitoxin system RelE/ParE family toxin [Pseudomonadota bacterium]MCL2306873.1 type II toxin-antitoxin system RelE/ParE family toxin [Pseudomonadota bacterium]
MPSVRWSPVALRDVQRLYRFLARKNPDAAQRAVTAIRQGAQMLKEQADIGRPIENMPEQIREWLIDFGDSGYVVRYRIDAAKSVMVLAVWHQKEAGI